jgi:ABC-type multidrug transport system ATPase subunit
LSKVYRGDRGLLPFDLAVERGECVAIVGHNGAGKSTFLKLLAGWMRPDHGEAFVGGRSITDRLAVTRKLVFVPETPNLYEAFTVEYNLALFARLFQIPAARVGRVLEEFDLVDRRRTKVQALSKGLRQRVALARGLLSAPEALLLDEPTSGLDFEATRDLYRRLEAVHRAGTTILFTSHRPEEVRLHATRLVVLHGGKTAFDGAPTQFFASAAHQELYQ